MSVTLRIHSSTICRLVLAPVLRNSLVTQCRDVLASGVVAKRGATFPRSLSPSTCQLVAIPVWLGLLTQQICCQMYPPAVVSGLSSPESFFLQSSPPNSPAVVSGRVSLNPSSFSSPQNSPDSSIGGRSHHLRSYPLILFALIPHANKHHMRHIPM